MLNKYYGGVIWTNHALQRMQDRNISQPSSWYAFRHKDYLRKATIPGAWVYEKTSGDKTIEVVAKQNEKKEWIILSVWQRTAGSNKYTPKKSFLWRLIRFVTG